MMGITVNKDNSGRITVFFSYDSLLVQKVKAIDGHRWHPDKKHWSFLDSNGTLENILKVFEGEEIHLDPALQAELSSPVIAIPTENREKQSQKNYPIPTLEKGGKGGFYNKNLSFKGTIPEVRHLLENGIDLRYIQELLDIKAQRQLKYIHM
jgi:hypothetical protein